VAAPKDTGYLIPTERLDSSILELRGERVMLDVDLADIYGVTTRRLKEQVRRNRDRFPEDFMFELTLAEKDKLVAKCDRFAPLKHSSSPPYAFTAMTVGMPQAAQHGAVMLASVLKSRRAVEVSVFVVPSRRRGASASPLTTTSPGTPVRVPTSSPATGDVGIEPASRRPPLDPSNP
jgi:hypothetical protein